MSCLEASVHCGAIETDNEPICQSHLPPSNTNNSTKNAPISQTKTLLESANIVLKHNERTHSYMHHKNSFIAYINVQGLTPAKLLTMTNWITIGKFKIIIIAETWFIDANNYTSHPFFLTHSLPNMHRRTGHQNGGLLVLVHPDLLSDISRIQSSTYSISFSIKDYHISSVYLPPSLTDHQIQTELDHLPSPDILLGDFNFRLGHQSGDLITTAPNRRLLVTTYATTHNLSYIRNTNRDEISRTDHVYCKSNICWTYHWTLPFRTDHGLLSIPSLPVKVTTGQITPRTRFSLRPLNNPVFSTFFAETYEQLYNDSLPLETQSVKTICCPSDTTLYPNTNTTQLLIDEAYQAIHDSIIDIQSKLLHSYDPQLAKAKPDLSLKNDHLAPTSTLHCIRTFKRSQRQFNASNTIQSRTNDTTPLQDCSNYYNELYSSPELPPIIERTNDQEISAYFTQSRIKQAIKYYPSHKSMGPDLIHTIVLKSLCQSPAFLQSLEDLFATLSCTGLIPSSWKTCSLHLLQKTPNNPVASNTRPIVLSPILRRIYEKILMNAWCSSPLPWMSLAPSQAGFRHGYSTISNILLSDEISRRDCSSSIFLDFKAAFDSISWNKLTTLLRSLNCPSSHLTTIQSLICQPANLLLSVNCSDVSTVLTAKGVFQGGVISAFIFAIYINPLAISLNISSPPHRPYALLFADDIVLKPTTNQHAQDLLNICSDYASDYSMVFNISKCAIVGTNSTNLMLSNQPLPRTQSYKYLGVQHTANGIDWTSTLCLSLDKQSKLLTALHDRPWHPKMRLIIYRCFIRPISEYVIAPAYLWYLRSTTTRTLLYSKILDVYRQGIRFIFQPFQYSPILCFLANLEPTDLRLQYLHGSLVRSLSSMSPENPLLLCRPVYCISASKHFILPQCFQSQLYTNYLLQKAHPNYKTLQWKTFLSWNFKASLNSYPPSNILLSYLRPSVPLKQQCQSLFRLPTPQLLMIVSWRLNRFQPSSRLCLCGNRFQRTHLNCLLMDYQNYRVVHNSTAYLIASQNCPNNLTVFDHLLNLNHTDHFLTLIELVKTILQT